MKMPNNVYIWILIMVVTVFLSYFYMKGVPFVDIIAQQYNETSYRRLPIISLPKSTSFRSLSLDSLSKIEYYKEYCDCNTDKISCGKYSTVYLINNQSYYRIGEIIKLKIDLFDQLHRHALEGGDILRIWGENSKIGASSAGTVIDEGNGVYTGYLKLLWTGKTTIHVMLAHVKEQIGPFFHKVNKNGITWHIQATYSKTVGNKNLTETKYCSPLPVTPDSPVTCNFTKWNDGMPWYCGKPSANFSCEDWKYSVQIIKESHASELIRLYGFQKLNQTITVNVKDGRDRLPGTSIPCSKRSIKETWQEEIPTGYFFKDIWYSLYCDNQLTWNSSIYLKCLKNRPVHIFGDSTSRQWFHNLNAFLNITFDIGGPEYGKYSEWHRYLFSKKNDRNIWFAWQHHELPFFTHYNALVKDMHSVGWRLDQIPENSNVIIILHWFIHLGMTTPEVFRIHIQNAVSAVKRLFLRSPNAKVLIKGPHSFQDYRITIPLDFVKQYAQQIIFEEFKDLQDKIVYLDEWDITLSSGNTDVHAPERTITQMTNYFISYVCDIDD